MNTQKRIAFAMVVSWSAKGVSILAALFLIPTFFRYMSKEELGVWYLLGNTQAFVGLLGFGLAPVLTRQIALLARKSYFETDVMLSEIEMSELEDLLFTGRTALRWLAIATMLVCWTVGYFLIRMIPLHQVSWTTVFWAWTLMCVGWSLTVWMSYLDCWLAGIGYVGSDTVITLLITIATTLVYIVSVVFFHGGLLALAWISIFSVFVQRGVLVAYMRRRGIWRAKLPGKWSATLLRRLIDPSLKYWGTAVGAFLLYKTDQYFIAICLGTGQVALYQSTYNTIMCLALVAGSAASSIVVFASQYWAEGDLATLHELLVRSCRIGFVILATGELFLAISGREFFQLWLKGAFIGYPVLAVLLLTLGLDTQHGLLTNISRATEDEKYVVPAIAAGAINLVLTWVFIHRYGIIGVPIGTLIAQLCTNNWYGVYRPLFRLQFKFSTYLARVVGPTFMYVILSLGIIVLARMATARFLGNGLKVACATSIVACSFTGLIGILMILGGKSSLKQGGLASLRSLNARYFRKP